jgi:predicted transposase YdaD
VPDHDALYHRLFSHPGMVSQLLREFVAESWVGELDLDAMERVNAKFHADGGERRDGDVVWRIPLQTGGDAYLLLLLEFQSTPDHWMALRVMVYAGLLWQHIVKEKRLTATGRLPPIFPVVVYNGNPRWLMPVTLRELIGLPAASPLWQWQPDLRYHIVDKGTFADADLAGRDTLAALLFRLENAREPARVVALVDAIIDWFRSHAGFEALMPMFATLAGRVVEMEESAAPGVLVSENLLEVRTMLATRAAEWKQQWRQEGLQEGLREGLQEGRQEGLQQGQRNGEAAALLRVLELRFGVLPDTVKQRIAAADLPLLRQWFPRSLDAASIDDVLR